MTPSLFAVFNKTALAASKCRGSQPECHDESVLSDNACQKSANLGLPSAIPSSHWRVMSATNSSLTAIPAQRTQLSHPANNGYSSLLQLSQNSALLAVPTTVGTRPDLLTKKAVKLRFHIPCHQAFHPPQPKKDTPAPIPVATLSLFHRPTVHSRHACQRQLTRPKGGRECCWSMRLGGVEGSTPSTPSTPNIPHQNTIQRHHPLKMQTGSLKQHSFSPPTLPLPIAPLLSCCRTPTRLFSSLL